MEFLLIPLIAIAAATVSIYKLAGLLFHIRLSCRLLILLVGFAWLVSLVLPGLFFHSAGFWGSLGVSAVFAAGFACLAAVYDSRTNASSPLVVHATAGTQGGTRFEATEAQVPDTVPATGAEPIPEPDFRLTETAAYVQNDKPQDGNGSRVEAEEAGMGPEASEPSADEQPESDSLEDLLDFAFAQRSRKCTDSALDTFRLVKHLYADSGVLPMVVAEIVSMLQDRNDWDGAAAELEEALHLPQIRLQEHLVRIFEEKLRELRSHSPGLEEREQSMSAGNRMQS